VIGDCPTCLLENRTIALGERRATPPAAALAELGRAGKRLENGLYK